MIKNRIISACLTIFILFSMLFSVNVSAAGGHEFNHAVLTDELTSLEYLYSYPNSVNNWQLITKTRTFGKYSVTGASVVCPDGSGSFNACSNWVVPSSAVMWYKTVPDRKLTKAEFTVWLNSNVGSITPVIKFKDEEGTVSTAKNAVWITSIPSDSVDTGYYRQMKGIVDIPENAEMVGLGLHGEKITSNGFFFDKAVITSEMPDYFYPKLYEEYADYFDISVAIEPKDAELYPELIENQFNVIVPENQMKSWIHKGEDKWWWQGSDQIVEYALKNGKKVRAHTLIYPDAFDAYRSNENAWFYKDENGNPLLDSNNNVIDLEKANELTLKRIEKHIKTIMSRYKGKVYAYDVVNEAFMERGAERTYLEFLKMLEGTDWFTKCFEWAHEADPDAVLIYNDNGFTNDILKQDVIYNKIKELRDKGIPVQIGMQMHYNAMVDLGLVERVLKRFSGLCDIYITELDMRISQKVLTGKTGYNDKGHSVNTFETIEYPEYMYDEAMEIQARKYGSLFELFRKYSDSIKSVGFWNACDGRTYAGTASHPLPFDENGEPKSAFYRILDFEKTLPCWEESDKLPQYRRIDYIIDKNTHTVKIKGDFSGEAKGVLYNPDGTENSCAEINADGVFELEIPIRTEKIPEKTIPEYTLTLKLGEGELLEEKFTYYTEYQLEKYYAIHDELNDFSKAYAYSNLALESNHPFYENDACGMTISNIQNDERYIKYKVPECKNVSSVMVDCYVYEAVRNREFPEIYVSSDGVNFGRISDNSDWGKEIPRKDPNEIAAAKQRRHFKSTWNNIPEGIKYVMIDLSQFSDWWYINLADVKIETVNDTNYIKPQLPELTSKKPELYINTKRGQVLSGIIHDGAFSGRTMVKNNSTEEKEVMFLTAVKDGEELVASENNVQILKPGEEKEFKTDSLDFGKNITDKMEMFLFDLSNKKLKPVSEKSVYMP